MTAHNPFPPHGDCDPIDAILFGPVGLLVLIVLVALACGGIR